jgi:integrase
MSVFKRGSVYWYEFWFKGRRVRESTRLKNKTAALRAEMLRRTELVLGKGSVERSAALFFDVFVKEEFLPWSKLQHQAHPGTHKRYRVSSKPLVRRFGKLQLDEITAAHIEQFKVQRSAQCSAAGVNRDLAAFRFMLNFAVRTGHLRDNPFKGVKLLPENPPPMRIISRDEEERYLKQAPPLLRDIATLILDTGMRPNEVFSIRRENVNLEKVFITIPWGKTRFARRTIPLTDRVAEIFKRRMQALKTEHLFPHRKGDKPMTACRSHDTVTRKLRLKFRIYDLRHTFGSRSAMAGVDLPTLKELMGHSSITLTMRYVHPTPEHKKEALAKLQRYNGAPTKVPTGGAAGSDNSLE